MKIGLSIAYDFFTNSPTSEAALMLKEHIGDQDRFLACLQKWGVTSIELRGLEWHTDKDTLKNIFHKLWQFGFALSIHSSLPEQDNIDAHAYLLSLLHIIPQIRSFQDNLIIVVHTYRGRNHSYEELLNKSANMINTIAAYIEDHKLPLKLALELNRGEKEHDPSVTYKGLLKIYSMIKHKSNIGFCWDFGHAYSNFSKGIIPLAAPENFASKVIHTHIHGVSKDDKTHGILQPDTLPLYDYLQPLHRIDYNGVFNLEINPQRIVTGKGILPALECSCALLILTGWHLKIDSASRVNS